jgi:hypothetical protein
VADGPPLQLHREKFTYNAPAKLPVYDWFSLDPAFVSVLERHPTSLDEARKATPFHTAAWLGVVGAGVFSAKAVFTSLDSGDDLTANDVESTKGDLIIAFGFATATAVFDAFGRRYLNRAVSVFNAQEMSPSGRGPTAPSPLGSLLRKVEAAPAYRPGDGGGWMAQFRLPVR